jgi:hypothetical protein
VDCTLSHLALLLLVVYLMSVGWTTEGSEFPASYPMGTEGSFPGGKADHSPPASVEVKKMWIYTSTTPYAFMA